MHSTPTAFRPRAVRGSLSVLLLTLSFGTALAIDSRLDKLPVTSLEPVKGIPYFLPKPVLVIRTTPEVDDKGKVKTIKVEVEKQIVADRSHRFLLLPRRGIFTAGTTSLDIDDGLLSSVNGSAENKVGAALEAAATFVFSLKTIPALEGQLAQLVPPASSKILSVNPVPPAAEKPLRPGECNDATGEIVPPPVSVEEFRKAIADSSQHASIKKLVADSTDQELIDLLQENWDSVGSKGRSLSFEQLVAGVDVETLKLAVAHGNALTSSPPSISLGGRLWLEVSLDFGSDDTATSTFTPPSLSSDKSLTPPKQGGPGTYLRETSPYRDQILVRGERPVAITLTLKPNVARTKALVTKSLEDDQEELIDLIDKHPVMKDDPKTDANEGHLVDDSASWTTLKDALKHEAEAATKKAEDAQKNHWAELQTWLKNEGALTEGRGAFNVALLPLFSAAKTAEIAELVADAEKIVAAAKLLEDSFTKFRSSLIGTVMKLHFLKTQAVEFQAGRSFASQVMVTTFPAPEAYQIPIERLALGKATTGLKLTRGSLRSFTVTRDAPALEFVSLPAKIVTPYITMLKDLIAIKVTTLAQSDDVLAQKVAIAKLENDLAALQKKPVEDPAAAAQAEAVSNLTRTKELLDLQKAILDLQAATKGADPVRQVQNAIETSQALQRQISALRNDVTQLP